MVKSFSVSTLILLCCSLLESAILSNIVVLPGLPDLSLLCVVYFSINNGRILGEGTGFISGLFIDCLSSGPFGLNSFIRTIIGYLGGIFNKTMTTDGILIPCLLGFFATLVKFLLLFFVSFLYPSKVVSYNPFTIFFVFELGCNTVLCPIVFKFLSFFRNSVLLKPESIVR